jgi:hypothetical protein
MRLHFFIFLNLLLFSNFVFSKTSPSDLIEKFDAKCYDPVRSGLNSLEFEARISNLTEILNQRLSIGKLKDVHYSIKWKKPRSFNIEVKGLPKGFVELKSELKGLILNRLDFVIPYKLKDKLKGYSLSRVLTKKDTQIKALDESYTKVVTEMFLTFKNKKLEKIRALSPTGSLISTLSLKEKEWSKESWVLDEYEIKSILGIQTSIIRYNISYLENKGFGLPEVIDINTSYEIQNSVKNNEKNIKKETKSQIVFSNYIVNKK